jgi:histidinol dehydrogenase/sulfopropanediol 3-dehydrogenase
LKVIKAGAAKKAGRDEALVRRVAGIVAAVRERGGAALLGYTAEFDRVELATPEVPPEAVRAAYAEIPEKTLEYMRFACSRIRSFAERQLRCLEPLGYAEGGVEVGHRLVPVERCGCYVPSGRYPLPSSALMSVTVAKTAGVGRVLACSPPAPGRGGIHPAVLAALDMAGADEIYCMGGAQAIAAYAYGAGPVEPVDLIVGPGNRYVTEAKRQVLGDVGIDGLAGPSEVLIIADETANPRWAAMDLLAQAEHDPDARCVLVSTSEALAREVMAETERFLGELPTGETAALSWRENGAVYVAESLEEAAAFSNGFAPEHLELQVRAEREREIAGMLKHYGSLFVGHYAPVAFGDFVTGTNHILPTMSTARFSSGLWAGTFLKAPVHQFVSREGYGLLAGAARHFAELEGLAAHAASVAIREEAFEG